MDDLQMISYALLGIVAVIGVTSLVLLFSGAMSSQVVTPGLPKVYVTQDYWKERIISPTDPSQAAMEYSLRKGNVDKEVRYVSEVTPSMETNPCYPNKIATHPYYYDYTTVDADGRPVPCEYVRISEFLPRG